MGTYECVVCGKTFVAKHRTMICPECKDTPATCVICGKQFKRINPYTQKTCSPVCRGKYRAQTGIAKAGANKMKQTKLERYGTLDPTSVALQKNGELSSKFCPLCKKEFIPTTVRQVYCLDIHYGECPVCGKKIVIKEPTIGAQACSEACRLQLVYATNLERYGNKDAVNSEHAKKLARQHSLERYGKEYYSQTDEFKERYKKTMDERYGGIGIGSPEIRAKIIETNLEKYGTEFASQSQEVRDKVIQTNLERYGGMGLASPILKKKIQATNLEKYGSIAPLQNPEVKEKIKKNSLAKHDVANPSQSAEAKEKRKQTNLEKYGVEYVTQSDQFKEAVRQTCIEKYGGPNAMSSPELREKAAKNREAAMLAKYGKKCSYNVPELREKIKETMIKKYGVPYYVMAPECMEHNYHAISLPNRAFADELASNGIESSFEFYIGRPSFDLKLNNSNILIEIDPTYSHNSFDNLWHAPKEPDYHLKKTQLAEENGYRCIHIFDWDNIPAIIELLKPKKVIYARKCSISKLDRHTADIFTEKYHLQGKCKGQNEVYGLIYEGELIELMSFGKPRYTKKYDFELLRLCTKYEIKVVGGASRLFKQFVKDHPNSSIISYCDIAKFSGAVYSQIGMKLERITPPAKIWSKGSEYITDNYLRQRGFDQIFKADYGKGTSNEQLMLEHGWLPVYDCGQKVFTYPSESL